TCRPRGVGIIFARTLVTMTSRSSPNSTQWRITMSETVAKSVDNGVKVEALVAAREALTNAPAAAQFRWRAACEWKNGIHSRSTVESFYGLGEEQHRKKAFVFDADHPEIFASEDLGATPVEY